jgi:hypothetical protein
MARRLGVMPRPIRWQGIPPKDFTVTGFVGMFDAKAKASEGKSDVPLLINLMPAAPLRPSHLTLRPGLTRIGTPTTVRLGAGTDRTPQWVGLGLTLAGTTRSPLVWCAGELYEITALSGGGFSKRLSTAQLAAAAPAITLSLTLPIGAAVFNGQVVFTQAGKRPFMWDGTNGGGLTVLTNAPISSGAQAPPTVYYGKLFFISTNTEIQWSEENQPNVGYTAGGYNNAWQLTETGSSKLLQLIGTNEGLYYGRRGAIGVIRGAVSSTFSTDGVRESVSPNVGPDVHNGTAMLYANGTLFWYDETARPWAWRAGTGAVPLWQQLPRFFVQENWGSADDQVDLYEAGEEGVSWLELHNITLDPVNNRVSFNGVALNASSPRVSLVFDVASLRPLCWQTWSLANKPTSQRAQWMDQGSLLSVGGQLGELYVDASGYVFYRAFTVPTFTLPTGQYSDETESTSGSLVTGTVVGQMHGWSAQGVEWRWDELAVVVDAQTVSVVRAAVLTSRAPTIPLSPFQTLSDSPSHVPHERAVRFGLNRGGRYGRAVVQVQAGEAGTNDRPAIHGWRLRGYPQSAFPSLP